MKFVIVIPARYSSTRFPGKPLAIINGKPMIQLTYEQAAKTGDKLVVATDDDKIYRAVREFGGEVLMTSADHQSGTDRCSEAIRLLEQETGEEFDVVINLQGDEPFIKPEQIELLKTAFEDTNTDIATLAKRIETSEVLFDPNVVKVVKATNGKALYFSRSAIPYIRNHSQDEWLKKQEFYKHIGMYAYRKEALHKLTLLAPSSLELSESLEQLRWLENAYTITVKETLHESVGIDTPEDLMRLSQ